MMDKLFITGMSRGGTTWLGKCLNEHPDVAVIGETALFGRYYVSTDLGNMLSQEARGRLLERQAGASYAFFGNDPGCLKVVDRECWREILLQVPLAPITIESLYDSILNSVALAERKSVVVEKTPHHLNHVDRIVHELGISKFVVMIRGPYSFMLSYQNQGLQQSRHSRERKAKFYHPIGCAIIWRGYAKQAQRVGDKYDSSVLLLRFEELKASPESEWKRVLEFFNLVSIPLPKIEDQNSSFIHCERPELEAIDQFWMNLIAKKAIADLGYTYIRANVSPVEIILSLLKLFPWAFSVLRVISNYTNMNIFRYAFQWIRRGM
ncbi:sulfotransferase family protein [Coraliomargarita sp. W4R72]